MKDENLNLHIRAQNGHGYVTPVRIKDAEVSPNDLPNEFTHCSLRVNLADILLRGVEAKSGQYVHLIDRVPAPGECIPGMRGECDVTIFIDTKFAASLGVKFYRAENRMFMARTEREFHRPKGIRPTAVKKVRDYLSGKRTYPTKPGEYIALPEWGRRTRGPVFHQEPAAPTPLPPEPEIDATTVERYPTVNVSYEATDGKVPVYMRCIRTTTGNCYLVRGEIQGMKRTLKVLVDTGAQINILPLDTYLRIPEAHRPKIEPINHRIKLETTVLWTRKGSKQ